MLSRLKDGVWYGFLILLNTLVLLAVIEVAARAVEEPWNFPPAVEQGPEIQFGTLLSSLQEVTFDDAYADFPWAGDFIAAREAAWADTSRPLGNRYEPFSLWKAFPMATGYTTFGEDGYRKTVNVDIPGASRKATVFVMGGSLVAGAGVIRDQDTIPSRLAAHLADVMPDWQFDIRNFGMGGFNLGNVTALLTTLLADQSVPRPDLVIVYSGINDLQHRVAFGRPHMAYDRFQKVLETAPEMEDSFAGRVVDSLRWRSAIVRFLVGKPAVQRQAAPASGIVRTEEERDARTALAVSEMTGRFGVMKALARGFEFDILFVLPPMLLEKSPLSTAEAKALDIMRDGSPMLVSVLENGYRRIRTEVSGLPFAADFRDYAQVFAGTAETVFVDWAHLSPKGTDIVAKAMADDIRTVLHAR